MDRLADKPGKYPISRTSGAQDMARPAPSLHLTNVQLPGLTMENEGENVTWGQSEGQIMAWGQSKGQSMMWGQSEGQNVTWGQSKGRNVTGGQS
eukprot:1079573-Pelagomonas_calceolata.AAC.10